MRRQHWSYLDRISFDDRLIIGRYLLEDKKRTRSYDRKAVELLFHRESPFSLELPTFFPSLAFDIEGLHQYYVTLYVKRGKWCSIERHLVNMHTSDTDVARLASLQPYCVNLKELALNMQQNADIPWEELLITSSSSSEQLHLSKCTKNIRKQDFQLPVKFSSLKMLNSSFASDFPPSTKLEMADVLLKTFAETLELLNPDLSDDWLSGELDLSNLICANCRNLRDFSFMYNKIPFQAFKNLVQVYATHNPESAFTLHLDPNNPDAYFKILEHCSNKRLCNSYPVYFSNIWTLYKSSHRVHMER